MNTGAVVGIVVAVVAIVINFFIAALIARAAEEKGRNFTAFFWLSFLFSWVIGAIVLALLPPLDAAGSNQKTGHEVEAVTLRDCPKCAEPILTKASFCKHCRSEITPLGA